MVLMVSFPSWQAAASQPLSTNASHQDVGAALAVVVLSRWFCAAPLRCVCLSRTCPDAVEVVSVGGATVDATLFAWPPWLTPLFVWTRRRWRLLAPFSAAVTWPPWVLPDAARAPCSPCSCEPRGWSGATHRSWSWRGRARRPSLSVGKLCLLSCVSRSGT